MESRAVSSLRRSGTLGGPAARLVIAATTLFLCLQLICLNGSLCKAAERSPPIPSAIANDAAIDEILKLSEKAVALEQAGHDAQAITAFEEVLAKAANAMGEDAPLVASLQRVIGALYQRRADYSRALKMYEFSLSNRQRILGAEHPEVANSLNSLASLHQELGDHPRALALYQRSLDIVQKTFGPEHETVAYALDGLSSVHQDTGDFTEATELSARSLAILERVLGTNHPHVASALNNRGEIYRLQYEFSKALPLFERSLTISRQVYGVDHPEVATTLNNLALAHKGRGEYARSLDLFQDSLAVRQRMLGARHPDVGASLANLARLYRDLGDTVQALALHRRSLAIMEGAFPSVHPYVAQSLMDVGVSLCCVGRDAEAVPLFHRSLAIRETLYGPQHPDVADTLIVLGTTLIDQGKSGEALPFLERSLRISETRFGKENPVIAMNLNCLAMAYHKQGELKRAASLYQRGLQIAEKTGASNSPVADAILGNLGLAALQGGDTETGAAMLADVFRRRRNYLARELPGLPERYAFAFAQDSFADFSILHSACENASPNRFAGADQQATTKALVEEVATTQAALDNRSERKIRELRERHHVVRAQMVRLSEMGVDSGRSGTLLRQLVDELTTTEANLAERVGLVAQTLRERNLTLPDIAWSLPPQAVLCDLVHYRRFSFVARTDQWKETRYAVYLTFPLAKDLTNVVVERVDLGEAAPINEAVELLCRRMGAGQFRANDLSTALQRLSELFYAPLARHLTNVSHLIVCPDGQLSRVPFEMLPLPPFGPESRYLVEEKTISYVTSGREIVRLARPATIAKTNAPVVMGNPDFDLDLSSGSSRREEAQTSKSEIANRKSEMDQSLLTSAATRSLSRSYRGLKFAPLPGSEEEAKRVAKLMGSDCVLRLGVEAREAELKVVVSPRVLHLATHGFFLTDQEWKRTNSFREFWQAGGGNFTARRSLALPGNDWENPMVRCGIALAGANHARQITNALAEDGLLTGLEASLLNLQGTELVILSACDSGTGEVKIGEGVMSLRRAFRIAGAETVLASHWKVSDKATSQLMTEFMRRWRGGEPRAQAWREAQLSLLHSKEFSNPYFWAAFTLTGQWR